LQIGSEASDVRFLLLNLPHLNNSEAVSYIFSSTIKIKTPYA